MLKYVLIFIEREFCKFLLQVEILNHPDKQITFYMWKEFENYSASLYMRHKVNISLVQAWLGFNINGKFQQFVWIIKIVDGQIYCFELRQEGDALEVGCASGFPMKRLVEKDVSELFQGKESK